MDYKQAYVNLISRAKRRRAKDLNPLQKYEWHHYFPVCFWRNRSQNTKTVPLTLREHWIAHRLLFKLFPSPGTATALLLMGKRTPKMNSRKFEALRLIIHQHNWTKTKEGRALLSEQTRENWRQGVYATDKARKAWSEHGQKLQREWKESGMHPLSSDAARQKASERAKARNKEMNTWLNKEKGKVTRVCEKCGTTVNGSLGNMKQHQRGRKCKPQNES